MRTNRRVSRHARRVASLTTLYARVKRTHDAWLRAANAEDTAHDYEKADARTKRTGYAWYLASIAYVASGGTRRTVELCTYERAKWEGWVND